jgi:hypothetical protein
MKTAIRIDTLGSNINNNGHFRHQALYKLDPGIEGNEYVILSTSYYNGNMGSYNENNPLIKETYIFAANKDGTIKDYLELDGSQKGSVCHAEVLTDAGYTILPK